MGPASNFGRVSTSNSPSAKRAAKRWLHWPPKENGPIPSSQLQVELRPSLVQSLPNSFHFFLLFSKCTVSQRSYRACRFEFLLCSFVPTYKANIMQQHQHQSSLTQRKAHHHNVTRLYDVQLSDCNRKVALKDPGIDSFGYLAFGPCSTSSFTPRVIWHSYEKWMNTACSRDDLPIKHSDFQLLHYQRVGLGSSDSSHSWCT